ncbi:MAG: Flp family type IVb pilin [Rubripirellula sp.]
MRKFFSNKKGQGLVEYGLIIAGVALVCAAAISLFGHKTADLVAATAAVLPGAHADDNAPIVTGKLIETAANTDGNITLNMGDGSTTGINGASDTPRLGNNLGLTPAADFGGLVVEAE